MQIEPTEHAKSEWARMAQAAYKAGENAIGHRYSAAAATPRKGTIDLALYDALQEGYRGWLIESRMPNPTAAQIEKRTGAITRAYSRRLRQYQRTGKETRADVARAVGLTKAARRLERLAPEAFRAAFRPSGVLSTRRNPTRIKWEHRKDPRGDAWVAFLKLPYTVPGQGPGTGRHLGTAAVRARLERDGWRIDNTQAVAGAWMPWEAIDEVRYRSAPAAKHGAAVWAAAVEARGGRYINPRGRKRGARGLGRRNPAEWAAQYITEAPSEASARHVLKGLALLDGYKGGRILPPTPQKPGWRVQTFHGDLGPGEHPEGMRRVLLTEGMARQLIRSGLRRNPRGRRKRNPTGYPFSGDPDEGGTYRPKLKRGGRPRRELDEDMQAIGAEHISRHEHETGEQVEYPEARKKNPASVRVISSKASGGRGRRTRVTLADGRSITFMGAMPKGEAIRQAAAALARDPSLAWKKNPDEATRRFLEAEIAAGRKDPASRHIAGTAPAARPTAARGLLEVQDPGGARRGRAGGTRKAQQAALFSGEELGEAQRDLFGRKRNPRRKLGGPRPLRDSLDAFERSGYGFDFAAVQRAAEKAGTSLYGVNLTDPLARSNIAAKIRRAGLGKNPGPFADLARQMAAKLSPEVSAKINADPAMRSWATLKDMLEEAERREGEPGFTPAHTARVRRYYTKARKEMLARLALHTGGQHGGPVRNPRRKRRR